ncbi:endonuclease domain-containing protein [Micromonospora palomenae]|uniref:endonuclease domain-containing protein n=1 Tax=Micromonospora palomenae TaxID=1461247 RepID=UPI003F8AE509
MPPLAHRPRLLAWQVFRGSDAVRHGVLSPDQLRSSAWVRLRHDVYADARLERDHGLACRAVSLRMPAGTVLAGPSAAYLHGVEHAAGFADDVHVLAPWATSVRSQRGVRVHTTLAPRRAGDTVASGRLGRRLTPGAVIGGPPMLGAVVGGPPMLGAVVGGPPMLGAVVGGPPTPRGGLPPSGPPFFRATDMSPWSHPAVAAWETGAWLDPVRAVGIVDSLLASGLTDPDALAEVAERFADRPGGRRARRVFDLADPGAQSPPESHLRVRLVLAGLPRPVTQHPVRSPSGLVLHPDLAWPEFRVAVEYDGQWHADPDQLHRDRQRLNQLVAAGWIVLHVTARRLRNDFAALLREIRTALAAQGWRR